jgi:hypothetical protein
MVTLKADPAPVRAAYQDGDGPWQTITPVAGQYQLQVSQGRYRLAYLCRTYGLDQHAIVLQNTPGDASITGTSCSREQETSDVHAWTLNLAGAPAGATFSLNAGNPRASRRFDGKEQSFKLALTAGDNTAIAAAVGTDGEVRVVINRFTVTGPGSLDLDFSPATTIVPLREIVVTNASAAERVFGALIVNAGTIGLHLSSSLFAGRVPLLDPARLGAGDKQAVSVGVTAPGGVARSVYRPVTGSDLGPFTMPPPVPVRVQLLAGTFPPHRPRVVFEAPVVWADQHFAQIRPRLGYPPQYPLQVSMYVVASSLVGGQFEFPELSQVLGLDAAWDPSAVPMTVQVTSSAKLGQQVENAGGDVKPDPM